MQALMLAHVPYINRRVVAALTLDDLVIQVAPHVTVILGLEECGVRAHLALADIRKLSHLVLLEAMLLVVVDVLERAQTVLARVARRLLAQLGLKARQMHLLVVINVHAGWRVEGFLELLFVRLIQV